MSRVIASGLLILSGCGVIVSSDSPLSPVAEAQLQKQLIGTWHSTDCPKSRVLFVHVSKAGGEGGGIPDALMRFLVVSQPADERHAVMHQEFLGYVSTIDDRLYLNVMVNRGHKFKKPHELTDESLDKHTYRLFKLRTDNEDHWRLFPMSSKAAARLVQAGTLEGTISPGKGLLAPIEIVNLASPPATLAAAVAEAEEGSPDASVFEREGLVWQLRRVK